MAYLPKEFYRSDHNSSDSLTVWADWVEHESWVGNRPNKIGNPEFIEALLLGLGLAMRELHMALFTEPDEFPIDAPAHLHKVNHLAWDRVKNVADQLAKAVDQLVPITVSL
jgi:hypothetical protein